VLIDRHMPVFDVSERHASSVSAPAERTYAAARTVNLARSGLVRRLFAARGLVAPARASGRGRRDPRTFTLDDLVRTGFVWLEDQAPDELVLGVVGAFWTPSGGIRRVAVEDFDAFDEPGLAKAVWNFRVIADGGARSILTTETRIRVPDDPSRRKFLLYWAVIGPFSAAIRRRTLALVASRAAGTMG
jgi:hypothetical protein